LGFPANIRRLIEFDQTRAGQSRKLVEPTPWVAVQWSDTIRKVEAMVKRVRSERLEVRTTPEDRALIDKAVAASGTDLTDFVVTNLTVASRRVLADRTEFALGPEDRQAWERINRRKARS